MSSKFLNLSTDITLGGNSPSDVTVSSQKAIKAYADTKQSALVSGTNIKTINNQSLLGSGNIEVETNVSFTYNSSTETLTLS